MSFCFCNSTILLCNSLFSCLNLDSEDSSCSCSSLAFDNWALMARSTSSVASGAAATWDAPAHEKLLVFRLDAQVRCHQRPAPAPRCFSRAVTRRSTSSARFSSSCSSISLGCAMPTGGASAALFEHVLEHVPASEPRSKLSSFETSFSFDTWTSDWWHRFHVTVASHASALVLAPHVDQPLF